ncbi:MAG: Gfo/Idh/MocA family oxidoreductase [Rhodothermales bacterium]|nr:Gfo/Idh/MocA family oxidoreductase [Rhodothermales bacterium]MBO6780128.1 Gfo/Idh/MocA family oxidoreductase [Rhodothermales bacterium]
MSDFSRREFLQRTTAVVGGAIALPSITNASAYYGTDDVIRVGLVGCGGRGTGAAYQALATSQNVQLVAVADAFQDQLDSCLENLTREPDDATGEQVRSRVQVPPEHRFVGFDGYRQVIPLVDVVLLATPPGFRPIHFAEAVAAGKHVFMEKPVATDAPGVRQVLESAAEAKAKSLNVVVGLQRHYQTVYREWVDRLHAGMIGSMVLGRVYWNSSGVWVRDRASMEETAGRPLTEMEYQMRNWYYFNWLCGDHICEQHIHNLDVGNWVMQGYPTVANGQGGREVRRGLDHGQIFDHHMVEFEYESGARVLSQCRHIEGCMNRVSEGFHGTSGSAPRPGLIQSASGHDLFRHDTKGDPNPYQVEHDELFTAIAAGEHRYNDGENGAYATLTSIMGRMATYTGREITWEEALNDETSLMPERFTFDADPPVLPDADGRYPVPVPGART